MHVGVREAELRVAEEDAVEALQRPTSKSGHAAIGGAAVVQIFVGEVDARIGADLDSDRRVYAVALQLDVAAEALAILIDAVDAHPHRIAERLVDIAGEAIAALAVAGDRELAIGLEAGALGDAVDDAAAAAAAEDHRIGPAQHLDPVGIVEVAEILGVVADAVDEEVGGRVVAAQRDLVAVALAGAGHRAGDIGQDVGDRAERLVLDLRLGHDRERLRDVLDVGVGLGRSPGLLDAILEALAGDHDLVGHRIIGWAALRSECRRGEGASERCDGNRTNGHEDPLRLRVLREAGSRAIATYSQ